MYYTALDVYVVKGYLVDFWRMKVAYSSGIVYCI